MDIIPTRRVLEGRVTPLGLTPDMTDAKQRSVRQLLSRLTADGDFAVMELPRPTASTAVSLMCRNAFPGRIWFSSFPRGKQPEKALARDCTRLRRLAG